MYYYRHIQIAKKSGDIVYQSDFSAGLDGWIQIGLSELSGAVNNVTDFNSVTKDNCLRLVCDNSFGEHSAEKDGILEIGKTYKVEATVYIDSLNFVAFDAWVKDGCADALRFLAPQWVTLTSDPFIACTTYFRLMMGNSSGDVDFQGDINDEVFLSSLIIYEL